jgi:cell division initiation protein
MEIRNQQFAKKIRGYSAGEVKNFLFQLSQDYEGVYSENNLLKEKNHSLQAQLATYQQMEHTMHQSIMFAQQAADMLKESARQEADVLLETAKKKIMEMLGLYQEVMKRLNMMNSEIKIQLDGQLALFHKNQVKLEEYTAFFFSNDFKELLESLNKAGQTSLNDIFPLADQPAASPAPVKTESDGYLPRG